MLLDRKGQGKRGPRVSQAAETHCEERERERDRQFEGRKRHQEERGCRCECMYSLCVYVIACDGSSGFSDYTSENGSNDGSSRSGDARAGATLQPEYIFLFFNIPLSFSPSFLLSCPSLFSTLTHRSLP